MSHPTKDPISIRFTKQCEVLEKVLAEARERDPYEIVIEREDVEGSPRIIVTEVAVRTGDFDRKTRIYCSGATELTEEGEKS